MGKEIIQIEHAYKQYGEKKVLDDFSLNIEKGETIAMIGSSGTGKTTLFNVITGTVSLDSGTVLIDGKEESTYNRKTMAKKLGMMTQKFDLVNELSVINNVLAGRLADWGFLKSLISLVHPLEKVLATEVLEQVNLEDKMYEKTANLSGGEQQRVALARVLVQNPEILLADEPIASLDPALSETVLQMLTGLTKDHGITLLCSLHSVEYAVRYFDRVVGLKDGKLFLNCKTEEISKEQLEELYR